MSITKDIWTDGAAPLHVGHGVPGGGIWWGPGDHRTKGVRILGENTSLTAEVGAVLQAIADIYDSLPGSYIIHTDLLNIVNFFNFVRSGQSWESICDKLILSTPYHRKIKQKLYQAIKDCPKTHKLSIVKAWWDEDNHKMAHFIARQAMSPKANDHLLPFSQFVEEVPPLNLKT